MTTPLLLALAFLLAAPGEHPWLDKQLAKQRVACPPGKSPVRGPADAKVTIVEFLDYECPYCAQEEPILQKVLAAYPTQVRLVIKNQPLDIHPKAKHKALFAACAGAQSGDYWKDHDALLAGGKPQDLKSGLDDGKLQACISQGADGQIDRDLALAKRLGMATTPGFVVDGIRQAGMINFAQFKLLIDAELARKGNASP